MTTRSPKTTDLNPAQGYDPGSGWCSVCFHRTTCKALADLEECDQLISGIVAKLADIGLLSDESAKDIVGPLKAPLGGLQQNSPPPLTLLRGGKEPTD